jgi:uncharacterized membrane protein
MKVGRVVMGGMYVVAGVGHFVATRMYERIMPGYIPFPWHHALVLLSGVAEILGGIGVIVPGRRRAAAWGIVCLLVAVWPANLWMAMHPWLFPGVPVWAMWVRLPLQVPLIWWAWMYTRQEVGNRK